IEKMKIVADRNKASVAQVALGWLLAKPYVTTILLGASKISQLEDNLGAADLKLSAEEVAELDQATAPTVPYPNWFQEKTIDARTRDALRQGLPARAMEAEA